MLKGTCDTLLAIALVSLLLGLVLGIKDGLINVPLSMGIVFIVDSLHTLWKGDQWSDTTVVVARDDN